MRTLGLSLGLALLCSLHAGAKDLGAAGLDKSKVIHSIPGREGGSVTSGYQGGDWGGVLVLGTVGDATATAGSAVTPR